MERFVDDIYRLFDKYLSLSLPAHILIFVLSILIFVLSHNIRF